MKKVVCNCQVVLLLYTLFSRVAFAQTCETKVLPQVFASVNEGGVSEIKVAVPDMANDRFFLGGSSMDSDIVTLMNVASAPSTPIVASLKASTAEFLWRKQIVKDSDGAGGYTDTVDLITAVDAIAINPQSTQIVVTLRSTSQQMILLRASDATPLSDAIKIASSPNYSIFSGESIILKDDIGNVIFAEVNQDWHANTNSDKNEYQIASYNIMHTLATDVVETWRWETASDVGRASSIALTKGGYIIAAGMMNTNQEQINTIHNFDPDTGVEQWVISQKVSGSVDIDTNPYSVITTMRLVELSGDEYVLAIAETSSPDANAVSLGIKFLEIILNSDNSQPDPLTVKSFDYNPANQRLISRATDAISVNEIQGLLFDTVDKKMFYVNLKTADGLLTVREMLTDDSLIISNGVFTGPSDGFIVGTVTKFGTAKTYSSQIGFVLSFDNNRNCYEVTSTESTLTLQASTEDLLISGANLTKKSKGASVGAFSVADLTTANWNLNDWCSTIVNITPSSIATQTYTVGTTAIEVIFDEFTYDRVCNDWSFQYTDIQPASVLDDSVVQVDSATRKVTIYTTDDSLAGTKTFTIVGTLTNGQTAQFDFDVDFQIDCSGQTMTPSQVPNDLTYTLGNTALTEPFTEFTIDPAGCNTGITYSLEWVDNATNNAYSAVPTDLFTFTTTPDFKVVIQNSDPSFAYAGSYTLKLTGTMSTLTNFFEFQLTILDPCEQGSITYRGTAIQDFTYNLHQGADVRSWTRSDFTTPEDDATCGTLTYSLTNDDVSLSTPETNVFTVNSDDLTTETIDDTYVTTYNLLFKAYQANYPAQALEIRFTVTVADGCLTMSLTAATDLGNQVYVLSKTAVTASFSDFVRTPAYCPVTYSFSSDVDSTGLITLSDREFTFYNADRAAMEGTYVVTVEGAYKTKTASFTFNLEAQHPCKVATRTITLPWSNFEYKVYDPEIEKTWTTNDVSTSELTCGDWMFDLTMGDDSALIAAFTKVTTDPYAFKVQTTDVNLAAVHTVKFIAWQDGFQAQAVSTTFDVTITDFCPGLSFTAPTVANQEYVLTKTAVEYTVSAFAFTPTDCPVEYELVSNPDTDVITFDPATRKFTFAYLDLDRANFGPKAKTVTLEVRAKSPYSSVTDSVSFDLELKDPCEVTTRTYTPGDFADYTYNLFDSAVTWTWADSDMYSPELDSLCGGWSYSIQKSDGSAVDAPFTVDLTAKTFVIESSDAAQVKAHAMKFKAWQGDYSAFAVEVDFTVTISDQCSSMTITPSTELKDTTQQYVLTKTQEDFTFSAFTYSPSYCPFTYTLENDPSGTPEPNLISFDDTNRIISFFYDTDASTYKNTYPLKVTGASGSNSASFTFTVEVKDPCELAARSYEGSLFTDYTYNLHDAQVTWSWLDTEMKSDETAAICGNWNYSILKADGGAIDALAFSTSGQDFFISSTDTSMVGDHDMVFKAWQGGYSAYPITVPFKITITDDCSTMTITASSLVSQDYILSKTQVDLQFAAFTFTPTYCPVVYSLTNSDDSAYDTALFTFDDSTRTVSVYHADVATKKGSYPLKVTGAYGANKAEFTFTITAKDPCEEATLSYKGADFIDLTYFLTETAIVWDYSSAVVETDDPTAACGAWSFSILKSDGTAIDSRAFTDSGTQFTIEASEYAVRGTHDMVFKAWKGTYSDNTFALVRPFTITIQAKCGDMDINPSSLPDTVYLLSKTKIDLVFDEFDYLYTDCPFVYTLTDTSGNAFNSNLFTFDAATRTISIFNADIDAQKDTYPLRVTGTADGTNAKFFDFTVTAKNPCEAAARSYDGTYFTDYTYDLHSTAVEWPWSDNDMSSDETTTLCGAWSYSILQSDKTTAIDALAFSEDGSKFAIYSTDFSMKGTHTMVFQAWQGSYTGFAVEKTFTVTITDNCYTMDITASDLDDQIYYLTKTQIDLVFDPFTFSPSYCPMVYTLTTDTGTAYESNLFTFDDAARKISIYSNDLSLYKGVYNLKVTGASDTNIKSFVFTVTAYDPCETATKSYQGSEFYSFTYDVHEPAVLMTWSDNDLTSSEDASLCGNWNYAITKDDGFAVDPRAFAIVVNTFKIESSDPTVAGTWPMVFKAWQGSYQAQAVEVAFTVTVEANCYDMTITPSSLNGYSTGAVTYYTVDTQLDLTFDAFTYPEAHCPFVYTLTSDTDGAYDSDLISFDDSARTISVYHNDLTAKVGTYNLKVTGASETNKADFQFTLTVIDPCSVANLSYSGSGFTSVTYDLFDSAIVWSFTDSDLVSDRDPSLCGAWQYEVVKSNEDVIDARAFVLSGQTFTIDSGDHDMRGTHDMIFRMWQGTYKSLAVEKAFTVTITDKCYTMTITASDLDDVTYKLTKTQLDLVFDPFTFSPSYCPMVYTLTTDLDGSFNSNLFTFDAATRTITVYDNDLSAEKGEYNLKVTGASETNIAEFIFKVTAVDPCEVAARDYNGIYFDEFTYDLWQGLVEWPWSDSDMTSDETTTLCGDWSYSITKSTGASIDSNAFSVVGNVFKIETTDQSMVGPHYMVFNAWQGSYTDFEVHYAFTVTITEDCATAEITTDQVIPEQLYILGEAQLDIQVDAFTSVPSYCPLDYSLSEQDDSAFKSPLIGFDDSTRVIDVFQSNKVNNAATYPLKVSVTYGGLAAITATLNFDLVVAKSCEEVDISIDASTFVDITLDLGEQRTLTWTDGHLYSEATTARCGDWNYLFSLQSGASLDTSVFTISTTDKTFKILTTDVNKAGDYDVRFTVWQGTHSTNSAELDFTVTIVDVCQTDPQPPEYAFPDEEIVDQFHRIGNPEMIYQHPRFYNPKAFCGNIIFRAEMANGQALGSGSNPDISYDAATRSFTFDKTYDTSLAGEYDLKLIVELDSNPTLYARTEITFKVTYIDCSLDTMSAPTPFTLYYRAGTRTQVFRLPDFTSDNGCIIYFEKTITEVDRTTENPMDITRQSEINALKEHTYLPVIIKDYDSVSNELTVFSRSSAPEGEVFRLKIQGVPYETPGTLSFVFDLVLQMENQPPYMFPEPPGELIMRLGDDEQTIQLGQVIDPEGHYTFLDVDIPNKNLIKYDKETGRLVINPDNKDYEGSWEVQIRVSDNYYDMPRFKIYSLFIVIESDDEFYFSPENSQPYFLTPPQDQLYEFFVHQYSDELYTELTVDLENEKEVIILPEFADRDEDEVKLTVDLGSAFPFTKVDKEIRGPYFLELNMTAVPIKDHTHRISLTLDDGHTDPVKRSFNLIFVVVYRDREAPPDPVLSDIEKINLLREETKKKIINVFQSARMEPISVLGDVTIIFDIPLSYPDDFTYQSVNETVLELTMIPGAQSVESMLGFTWTCTGLTRTHLYLNLQFEYPVYVSSHPGERDSIRVVFLKPQYFIGDLPEGVDIRSGRMLQEATIRVSLSGNDNAPGVIGEFQPATGEQLYKEDALTTSQKVVGLLASLFVCLTFVILVFSSSSRKQDANQRPS